MKKKKGGKDRAKASFKNRSTNPDMKPSEKMKSKLMLDNPPAPPNRADMELTKLTTGNVFPNFRGKVKQSERRRNR